MVPFRFIGQQLGATVSWDAPTRTVSFASDTANFSLVIDEPIVIDGNDLGAAVIVDGRTLVPVRVVSLRMGTTATWDGTARTVTIPIPAPEVVQPTPTPTPVNDTANDTANDAANDTANDAANDAANDTANDAANDAANDTANDAVAGTVVFELEISQETVDILNGEAESDVIGRAGDSEFTLVDGGIEFTVQNSYWGIDILLNGLDLQPGVNYRVTFAPSTLALEWTLGDDPWQHRPDPRNGGTFTREFIRGIDWRGGAPTLRVISGLEWKPNGFAEEKFVIESLVIEAV